MSNSRERDLGESTVLLVDDNPENLRILREMLAEQGCAVRVARNGQQALRSVEAAPPDVVLLDVHMPEVARGLAANGAEIIAMPIMGGHPALDRARAIENQIYLVTSTYSVNDDWMQSGVWGLDGDLLVRATEPDSVVVAEVDLSKQHFWRANMGDFKSRLVHERPNVPLPE